MYPQHKVTLLDFIDVDVSRYKEHLTYSFRLEGFSRAVLQESSRHVTLLPSVKSTRYTLKELKDLTAQIAWMEGPKLMCDVTTLEKFCVLTGDDDVDASSALALENTRQLIRANKSNDVSKYSLVESYRTSEVVTVQKDGLQNLLNMRIPDSALLEFRHLTKAIYGAIPQHHKGVFLEHIDYEDIISEMMQMQHMMNNKTNGTQWLEGITKEGNSINWLRCCNNELYEANNSISWEHWKYLSTPIDIENIKMELVDAWHFLMSYIILYNSKVAKDDHYDSEMIATAGKLIANDYAADLNFDSEFFMSKVDEFMSISTLLMARKEMANFHQLASMTEMFFHMVSAIGMTTEDLYNRYKLKYALNHYRQENGYKQGTYLKVIDGMEDNERVVEIMYANKGKTADEIIAIYDIFYKAHLMSLAQEKEEKNLIEFEEGDETTLP